MDTKWLETISIGQAITWALMLATVWGFVAKVWPILRDLVHSLDDLRGEPARPGVPRTPGIIERLTDVEQAVRDQGATINQINYHVKPNHGNSAYDALTRKVDDVAAQGAETHALVAALGDRMNESEADRARIWRAIGRPWPWTRGGTRS